MLELVTVCGMADIWIEMRLCRLLFFGKNQIGEKIFGDIWKLGGKLKIVDILGILIGAGLSSEWCFMFRQFRLD